jgi:hypothetical protein
MMSLRTPSGTSHQRTVDVLVAAHWLLAISASSLLLAAPAAATTGDSGPGESLDPTVTSRAIPSSTEWIWKHLEPLWEVWTSRVLVTIAIVLLFDFLSSSTKQSTALGHQRQQEHQPTPRTPQGGLEKERDHAHEESVAIHLGSKFTPLTASDPMTDSGIREAADGLSNDPKIIAEEEKPPAGTPEEAAPEAASENGAAANIRSSSPPSAVTTTTGGSLPSTSRLRLHTRISAASNQHPGMAGFAQWYEVETSLYRIYTLTRKDGAQVVPPYVPKAHRGNINIFLHVTNSTNRTINVFWVDYKGKHISKGKMPPNHVWVQTTWLDHRECTQGACELSARLPFCLRFSLLTVEGAPISVLAFLP